MRVKGKAEPVRVYKLLRTKAQPGQTVALGGDFHSRVRCAGTVVPSATSPELNLLAGVEVLPGGRVDLGEGTLTVQDASTAISGGTLSAETIKVGTTEAEGKASQSGGTVTADGLRRRQTPLFPDTKAGVPGLR